MAFRSKGELGLAIRDYTKAIKLDRRDPNAYNNRGNTYHEQGQADLAIQDYSKAIKIDKKYVDAYMNRGVSYDGEGQYDLAIKDYARVIELEPTFAPAYFQRGHSYEKTGQAARAISDYESALSRNPSDAASRQRLASLRSAGPAPSADVPRPVPASPPVMQKPRVASVSKDTSPPEIRVQRASAVVSSSRHTVIGRAVDRSGVGIVEVNGQEAQLDEDGNFSAMIILKPGANRVEIVAIDIYANQSAEVISIVREAGTVARVMPAVESTVTGEFHALLLAVDEYQDPGIDGLSRPIGAAGRIRSVLQSDYAFASENVTLLTNPDQRQIVGALDKLSRRAGEADSVLIFYAGHGDWDEQFGQGYWLPSDAEPGSKVAWVYNSTIRDYIRGMRAKNVLVVSDACFAGSVFDWGSVGGDARENTKTLFETPARLAMTSGTLIDAPDDSAFVDHLVRELEANREKYLSSEALFARLKDASQAGQMPEIGRIRESGDEGGDFIFLRR